MAVPEYRDEVLITLSSVDPPVNFAFPDRRIFLSKKNPSIEIGRTSKRNVSFEAAKCNAWFDSPVMSRKHALFTLDAEQQKVYLKDTGSLHGTYKNDVRLENNVNSEVTSGDKLKFGAIIERGMDKYPPCSIEARFRFGSMDPDHRGNCFRVPEESDGEDMSSDDDQVRNSYEFLCSKNIRPAAFPSSPSNRSPIDLTCDDQYPLSNVRDDAPSVTCSSIKQATQPPNIPPPSGLSDFGPPSPPRIESGASKDASTSPNDNTWELSDMEEEEEDANVSQSTNMDTGSSCDNFSEAQSTNYAPSPVVDVYDDLDSADEDEQDFNEHDEFECEQDDFALDDSVYPANDYRTEEAPVETSAIDETPANQSSTEPAATCSEPRVDSFSSQAPTTSKHSDGTSNAQLDKINYLLNSNLPPMAPTHTASSMKLPSISEAMPFDPYIFGQKSAAATVEIMGRKTGKYEYFAAREENKANASATSAQSRPQLVENTKARLPDEQHTARLLGNDKFEGADVQVPAMKRSEAVQPARTDQAYQLATCGLVSCGTKFLNTPLQQPEPEPASAEPVLDDSSAWSFEMSKKASSAAENATKAVDQVVDDKREVAHESSMDTVKAVESLKKSAQEATTTEDNEVEATDDVASKLLETPRGSKRKAGDISHLTPEEERKRSHDCRRRVLSRRGKKWAAGRFRHETPAVAAPPPRKRLRRVAEVVGYAALGGVAVMSALIATAPTL